MSIPFLVWVKHDWADNLGCSLTLAMCMYNFLLICMLGIKGEIPKVMFALDFSLVRVSSWLMSYVADTQRIVCIFRAWSLFLSILKSNTCWTLLSNISCSDVFPHLKILLANNEISKISLPVCMSSLPSKFLNQSNKSKRNILQLEEHGILSWDYKSEYCFVYSIAWLNKYVYPSV